MGKKIYTAEQIISKLREVEGLTSQGDKKYHGRKKPTQTTSSYPDS